MIERNVRNFLPPSVNLKVNGSLRILRSDTSLSWETEKDRLFIKQLYSSQETQWSAWCSFWKFSFSPFPSFWWHKGRAAGSNEELCWGSKFALAEYTILYPMELLVKTPNVEGNKEGVLPGWAVEEKTGEKYYMRMLAMRQPWRIRVSTGMWLAEEEIQDVPWRPSNTGSMAV